MQERAAFSWTLLLIVSLKKPERATARLGSEAQKDARSGSIEFVFDIGEKRFRVVRTRTKSGKPTLNLSQLQDEGTDWLNLSKERIVDTQAEIEKLLGMDSMTFRSCALIMQDQYGLFLRPRRMNALLFSEICLDLGFTG